MGLSIRSLRVQFTGIMLSASLAFAAAVLPIAYFTTRLALDDRTLDSAQDQLDAHARNVADLVLIEDALSLREYIQGLATVNSRWVAVYVFDGQGRLLAQAPDDANQGRVWPVARDLSGRVTRQGDGERVKALSSALVDERVGSLRAVVALGADDAGAAATTWRVVLAMAALTLMGVGLALLLGRRLTADLDVIARHAVRIGQGDLAVRVPHMATSAEVALLGATINEMSTRLQEARDALVDQQRQLVQVERLAALGTFAAGAAHEVVNPLSGVAGCIRRLSRPELPDDRRTHYADLALDGLARATRVLRSLLTFARAEPGPPQPARLPDLLHRAVELSCQGCEAEIRMAPGHPVDVGWPVAQVEQVLTNLLLNAVQAAGSRVDVRWGADGDRAWIEVMDDGPGIPDELHARVFEPFFTTRKQGEGTGLGLSVSRSVIEALGGRIELRSRPDGGSGLVARIELPRHTPGGRSDAA